MSVNLTRRFQISSNLSKRLGWKDCSPNAVTASTNPVFDPAHGRRCESIWVRNSSSAATRLVARVRCVGVRLLRPGQTNLRCPDAERTTPSSRLELVKHFKGLGTTMCPFANLPEAKSGRWGAGLTAAKMKDCRWLKPKLVGQFEFVEWTPDDHLRHSRFVGATGGQEAGGCGSGELARKY